MRIKEIISEDVLRASGGQQPAVMPPVPIYPQPPRPAAPVQPLRPHLPNAATRPPNTPVTPAHRPPPPHSGVGTTNFIALCVWRFLKAGPVKTMWLLLILASNSRSAAERETGRSPELLPSLLLLTHRHKDTRTHTSYVQYVTEV